MAAGLGLLPSTVIDQHFEQRNRYGRLLMIVAQSPQLLGMGVDEDTAAIVQDDVLSVVGRGAVTILDPSNITTNAFDAKRSAPHAGQRRGAARAAAGRPLRPRHPDAAALRDPRRPARGRRDRGGRPRPAPDGPRHRGRRRLPERAAPTAAAYRGPAPTRLRSRTPTRTETTHDRTAHARPRPSSRRGSTAAPTSGPTNGRSTSSSTSGRWRSSRPTPSPASPTTCSRCCPGCGSTPAPAASAAASSSGSTRGPGWATSPSTRALALAAGRRPRHPPRQDPPGQGPARATTTSSSGTPTSRSGSQPRGSPYAWSTTSSRPTRSSTGTRSSRTFILRAERTAFGPSTQAILDEAVSRDIPWIRLNQYSLVQLGQGVHAKRIRATMTSATSAIAVDIASDKDLTTRLLGAAGLPVPKQDSGAHRGPGRAGGGADRLPGRPQAAGRQPRPRRLPRPAERGGRAGGVPDRRGAVPARRDRGGVADPRQGLPLPDHRRPDRRDRRARAGVGHRRRHRDHRAARRHRERRPAPRRRPREGADPDQGRRRRRSSWSASRATR